MSLSRRTVAWWRSWCRRVRGRAALKQSVRNLVLTGAGHAAMRLADQLFALGEQLPGLVRDAASHPGVRLAVGISDGLPKLVVRRLLQTVLDESGLRLLCHEDEFDNLLADLALHRLDVVLADRAAAPSPNLKVYSHALGSSALSWYAPESLQGAVRHDFPRSLSDVPVLLPTAHAAVRARIDHWFEQHGIRPRIAGEFEDSALLVTFGQPSAPATRDPAEQAACGASSPPDGAALHRNEEGQAGDHACPLCEPRWRAGSAPGAARNGTPRGRARDQ